MRTERVGGLTVLEPEDDSDRRALAVLGRAGALDPGHEYGLAPPQGAKAGPEGEARDWRGRWTAGGGEPYVPRRSDPVLARQHDQFFAQLEEMRRGWERDPDVAERALGNLDPHQMLTGPDLWDENLTAQAQQDAIMEIARGSGLDPARVAVYFEQWAYSSAARPESAAIQLAVADRFGVQTLAGPLGAHVEAYERGDFRPFPGEDPRQTPPPVGWGEMREEARRFVDAMYEHTQRELAANGVKEMVLYRGLVWRGSDGRPVNVPTMPEGFDRLGKGGPIEVNSNPATSWTLNYGTAHEFTDFGGEAKDGHILAVRVPADRILSTALTGLGSLPEFEVTVVGGAMRVQAASKDVGFQDPRLFERTAYRPRTPAAPYKTNYGDPNEKAAHDVTDEARDDHGRWTGEGVVPIPAAVAESHTEIRDVLYHGFKGEPPRFTEGGHREDGVQWGHGGVFFSDTATTLGPRTLEVKGPFRIFDIKDDKNGSFDILRGYCEDRDYMRIAVQAAERVGLPIERWNFEGRSGVAFPMPRGEYGIRYYHDFERVLRDSMEKAGFDGWHMGGEIVVWNYDKINASPRVVEAGKAAHDVSDEARDDHGRWTDGGAAIPAIDDGTFPPDGNRHVRDLAQRYLAENGMPPVRDFEMQALAPEEGHAIAAAYAAAADDPSNPATQAAYAAFNDQIKAQYEALVAGGMRLEPWGREGQPYKDSKEMRADVAENGHLYYFKTEQGTPIHDLMTPEENDRFRAVHDMFGHAQGGFQFGPKGETNAYLEHSQMFTREALPALTTETLAQNAWFNFGPDNEGKPITERRFADQKATTLDPALYADLLRRRDAALGKAAGEQEDEYGYCPVHRHGAAGTKAAHDVADEARDDRGRWSSGEWTTGGDAVPGGYNGYIALLDKDRSTVLGTIDYQITDDPVWDDGKVLIAMVDVPEANRRQGIGMALLGKLAEEVPDRPFDWGMMTEEGAALRAAWEREHPPGAVKAAHDTSDEPRDERGRWSTEPGAWTASDLADLKVRSGLREDMKAAWAGMLDSRLRVAVGRYYDDYKYGGNRYVDGLTQTLDHMRTSDGTRAERPPPGTSPLREDPANRAAWVERTLALVNEDPHGASARGGFAAGVLKNDIAHGIAEATGLTYERANEYVREWTGTSTNSFMAATVQQAAAERFGFKPDPDGTAARSIIGRGQDLGFKAALPEARRVVEAVYNLTQAALRQAGVERVPLYRGMQSAPQGWREGSAAEARQNPLSSWSLDPSTARAFGGGWFLEATVPRERVWSTALTGFGSLPEREFVLIGGPEMPVLVHEGGADQIPDAGYKAAHDVSDEPRDERGRWTVGGAAMSLEDAQTQYAELKDQWARINNELLQYVDHPNSPLAIAHLRELKDLCEEMNHLPADPGGPAGVGLPGGPRDIVCVGGGPGGLSAAINGKADGLDVLVVEANEHVGGQAAHSSRIENFPGFPMGVTGERLASTMYEQATRLGAEVRTGVAVTGLRYDEQTDLKVLTLSTGETIEARAVILAGGVEARRLDFPGGDSPNVVYGDAGEMVDRAGDRASVVIGGSNGAAQAALGAAERDQDVTVIARGDISKGMSDYQVSALENNPRITVIQNDEIASYRDGVVTTREGVAIPDVGAVGIFAGGSPATGWLPPAVERDGPTVAVDPDLRTTVPGVYAVGDIRSGGPQRILGSAGDGQMAERHLWQYLHDRAKAAVKEAGHRGRPLPPDSPERGLMDRNVDGLLRLDLEYPYFCQTGEPDAAPVGVKEAHDVSGEARDEAGRWTADGALVEQVRATGGFTYDPTTGSEPIAGYVVSAYPERSEVHPAEAFDEAVLAAFEERNADVLAAADVQVGAWAHEGRIHLDIVQVVADRAEAVRLGHERGQIAVWDLAGKSEIQTGNEPSRGKMAVHGRQAEGGEEADPGRVRPGEGDEGGPLRDRRAPEGGREEGLKAGRDVSDEARDDLGRWTVSAAAAPSAGTDVEGLRPQVDAWNALFAPHGASAHSGDPSLIPVVQDDAAHALALRSGLSVEDCRHFIDGWSHASTNGISLTLQLAASERFGIPLDRRLDYQVQAQVERSARYVAQSGGETWDQTLDKARIFLVAAYDETQERLKAAGIEQVTVFRGMGLLNPATEHADHPLAAVAPPTLASFFAPLAPGEDPATEVEARVSANPLSSWSMSVTMAASFANAGAEGTGVLLATTIPRERVFSIPFTAVGSLSEREVVIVGGQVEARALNPSAIIRRYTGPDGRTAREYEAALKAAHDVSDEARDEAGRWTVGGAVAEWVRENETARLAEADLRAREAQPPPPKPPAEGLPYMSKDEASAWADKHFGAWAVALTEPERAAFKAYTGFDYALVSGYLRRGPEDVYEEARGKTASQIAEMDRAMARPEAVLSEPVIVFRDMGADIFTGTDEGLVNRDFDWQSVVGTEVQDKGFTSTALSRPPFDFKDAVAEIRVPAGTRVASMDGLESNPELRENELLLDRGQTFRVISVGIVPSAFGGTRKHVVMEVVPR